MTASADLLSGDRLFVADGGLETTLIFREGIELACFASFDLLTDETGIAALRAYYEPYVAIARARGAGFVFDTPTWRASADWGERLGYSAEQLDAANRKGVALGEEIRAAHPDVAILVNGILGPRGDGYDPGETMSAAEAERYHARQVGTFAEAAADMVSGMTMTYAEEAVGIARAAAGAGIPVVISFTVETDGRLPTGQPLAEAVEQLDAESGAAAAFVMINCAHPTHFAAVIEEGGPWLARIGGVRANASRLSHAELDESETLDDGDPIELGSEYHELRPRLENVRVVGGCCGTDQRHVDEVCKAWLD